MSNKNEYEKNSKFLQFAICRYNKFIMGYCSVHRIYKTTYLLV